MKICSIASGSSGNCIYVEDLKTKLLVDVGISGRRVTNGLSQIGVDGKELDGILVTHDHEDHIKGVGILSRKYDLPIYANEGTWEVMKDSIGKIHPKNVKYFDSKMLFSIKDFCIEPFPIPHDAKDPVGFSIYGQNKKMSIATDLGYINNDIFQKLDGADMVLLEANHDVQMLKVGPYPYYLKRRILGEEGHLSNESAGNALVYLVKMGLKQVLLTHLSKQNNFPELAYQTVYNMLINQKIKVGKDVKVDVAHRDNVSQVYCL